MIRNRHKKQKERDLTHCQGRSREMLRTKTQKGDWKTGTEKWGLETAEKLLGKSRQDRTRGLSSTRLSDDTERGQLHAPRKGDVSQLSGDFGGQGKAPHQRGPWPPAPCRACGRIAAKH